MSLNELLPGRGITSLTSTVEFGKRVRVASIRVFNSVSVASTLFFIRSLVPTMKVMAVEAMVAWLMYVVAALMFFPLSSLCISVFFRLYNRCGCMCFAIESVIMMLSTFFGS